MEKKILGAVLLALLFLTSCERADLPKTITESTLVIHRNGRLTEYLVEEFDRNQYDLEELCDFVEAEVSKDSARELVRLERVEGLESGKVLVVLEYPGKRAYAGFNGCTLEDIEENRLPIKIVQGK